MKTQLNRTGLERAGQLIRDASRLKIGVTRTDSKTTIVDLGVDAPGGLAAGIGLAEVCLAGLAQVAIGQADSQLFRGPSVSTTTDHPIAACMGAQYAGWPVQPPNYFAMGSGPMRAARGKEDVLAHLEISETPDQIVGVLEAGSLPDNEACRFIADECSVEPRNVTLLVAPTASLAGAIQVVARSVETCLHKMHELGFDLNRVASGFGTAPLPPIAKNDLAGIGLTNDSILYGGQVTVWMQGDDDQLNELGPQIPSHSSHDYGRPFAEIFKSYDNDFYKIDPLLFSPAQVTLVNLDSGRSFCFGNTNRQILSRSFQSV